MFGRSRTDKTTTPASNAIPKPTADGTSDTALFLQSLKDPDIIERVRVTIKNAHVFKLPPRQTVSVGWRGADWKEKVWQGTVKVVERGDQTAILLVDRMRGSIFAVCPVKEGAVDRCVDSSRYFVLRIENATGRHMFIGVAFNERNDAFDFNTALEDSRREKELEKMPVKEYTGPTKDYSIKDGEKIHVAIPKVASGGEKEAAAADDDADPEVDFANAFGATSEYVEEKKPVAPPKKRAPKISSPKGGFLAPSSRDTPSRTAGSSGGLNSSGDVDVHVAQNGGGSSSGNGSGGTGNPSFFSDNFGEPFPSSSFGSTNPFKASSSDDPFFSSSEGGS